MPVSLRSSGSRSSASASAPAATSSVPAPASPTRRRWTKRLPSRSPGEGPVGWPSVTAPTTAASSHGGREDRYDDDDDDDDDDDNEQVQVVQRAPRSRTVAVPRRSADGVAKRARGSGAGVPGAHAALQQQGIVSDDDVAANSDDAANELQIGRIGGQIGRRAGRTATLPQIGWDFVKSLVQGKRQASSVHQNEDAASSRRAVRGSVHASKSAASSSSLSRWFSSTAVLKAFTALCLLLSVMVVVSHHQQMPYCPTRSTAVASTKQQCKPCPEHAVCLGGPTFTCNDPYQQGWRGCVLNTALEKLKDNIAHEIVVEAQRYRGQRECESSPSVTLSLAVPREAMRELVKARMETDAQFTTAWNFVCAHPEKYFGDAVEVRMDGFLAKAGIKPFECQLREELLYLLDCVAQAVFDFFSYVWQLLWLPLLLVLFFTLAVSYFKWQKSVKQNEQDALNTMVLAIMTLLREQAISQPFQPAVSVSHLRDEIIDVSDRKRLAARWDEACKIVRRDSRVAQSVQSIHGIPQDMLSWVSPVVVASPMAAQRQASPLVDNPDNADNGGGDENDRQPAIRSPQAQHRPYASSIYPNIADL